MADRFPLILNTSTNQIQEIPSGDNLDLTGTGISNAGIITAGNVTIGAATTDLIVSGDARITGILTVGTGSLTLDGPNNLVNVGTALTLGHTQGLQFHTQNLHSAGFEVNQINVSGASTMGGDVTFTGDNYNVLWDKSQNQLEFADNAKALFGTDGDLFVFHNGSNSYVQDAGQGILFLDCSETNITKYGSNHNMAKFIGGGAVELYHNNTKRFETTTSGVTVTGDGTFTGNVSIGGTLTYEDVTNIDSVGIVTAREGIFIPDNKELKIGNTAASSDLRIYSNGSSSYVDSYGGNFLIRVSDQSGGVENKLIARPNAQIELYYNDAKKLETRSNGITVTGYTYSDGVTIGNGTAEKYLAGDSNQLQMYHTGSSGNGYINNGTGTLLIGGPIVSFTNQANNAFLIRAVDGGTSELYFNGSKKFETTSSGVTVTGTINFGSGMGSGLSSNGFNINFADSNGAQDMAKFGDSGDLKIYHQSNSSYIINATGNLNIGSNNEVRIKGGSDVAESMAVFKDNGAVELYHDNVLRLATKTWGVQFYGDLENNSDSTRIKLGVGDDLQLWHSGTDSYILNNTNQLYVRSNQGIYIQPNTNENGVVALPNAGVELYHNNVKKFNTISGGAVVTGNLGVGDASSPSHQYDQGIQIHANGTGAVLHLTDASSGSGTGDGFDIISHASSAYLWQRENANMIFGTQGVSRWNIHGSSGSFYPSANNTYDIGTDSMRVRNIYTNDLNLSNEGSANDVDGTWGNYTIQEGESDLFLINKRSGKKYKFNLTEVS